MSLTVVDPDMPAFVRQTSNTINRGYQSAGSTGKFGPAW
jgi:hypothetical protein